MLYESEVKTVLVLQMVASSHNVNEQDCAWGLSGGVILALVMHTITWSNGGNEQDMCVDFHHAV